MYNIIFVFCMPNNLCRDAWHPLYSSKCKCCNYLIDIGAVFFILIKLSDTTHTFKCHFVHAWVSSLMESLLLVLYHAETKVGSVLLHYQDETI